MPAFSFEALVRAMLVWLLLMAAETAQGALRRILTHPDMEFAIRQVSVVIGAAIVFGLTWVCFRWLRIRTTRHALAAGALWVAMTVAFEIGLGRAMGYGWDRLLSDYDLGRGGLMPLGLLAMALTPWLVLRLRQARGHDLGQGGNAQAR